MASIAMYRVPLNLTPSDVLSGYMLLASREIASESVMDGNGHKANPTDVIKMFELGLDQQHQA